MTVLHEHSQSLLNAVDAMTLLMCEDRIVAANHDALTWLGDSILNSSIFDYLLRNSRRKSLVAHLKLKRKKLELVRDIFDLRHPDESEYRIEATIKPANFIADAYYLVTFRSVAAIDNKLKTSDFHTTIPIVKNFVLAKLIRESQVLDKSLNRFLENLQTIIPYDSASIALINKNKLEFIAARGLSHIEDLSELDRSHEPLEDKVKHLITGEVQIIADVSQSPDWIQIDGTEYIRSWIGVPLFFEGNLIGVLNLDHHQAGFFTSLHARYARAMAEQATMAIVYTQLYEEAQEDILERQRLQEVLVKNLITTETLYAAQQTLIEGASLKESLLDVLEITSAAIDNSKYILIAFDVTASRIAYFLHNLEDDGAAWQVFSELINLPYLPREKMPPKDIILLAGHRKSLKDGRKLIAAVVNKRGLMIILRDSQEPDFLEDEQELINNISSQITLALENRMLYEELQEQKQQLERTVEIRNTQLSVEKRRLEAILDATAEGIFYMENFLIQYANPAFCRMVGYSLEELYGKPLSFLRVMPEIPEQHNFNALLDNPFDIELGRSETRLRHRNGREFHASIRFSLVGQTGENPVRMVAIARDVSQERKLYFQRARFIANAAHELRTPLSSLVLRLHMLRRQPERSNEHLDSLDKVTNYLRQLVEQLLDLSRFERGTIQLDRDPFILQELLQQAVQEHLPFAEEEGVSISLEMDESPIAAKVDGTRFVQAFSNLVVNGINYNKRGGEVAVSMQLEEDVVGNQNVLIEVKDNGLGIEPDLLPDDIFEPFVRPSQGTRKETGMGLALVKEIIHLHGGVIYAMPNDEVGSRFEIKIPIDG